MQSKTQYRNTWRYALWPQNKPTAARVFRFRHLADEHVRRLRADVTQGVLTIYMEERDVTSSPWRPCDLEGGAR